MSISLAFSCGHALVIGACYRQKVAKHKSGRVYLSQITSASDLSLSTECKSPRNSV